LIFLLIAGLSRVLMAQTSPDSTNLPLVILNTNGKTIPDGYKIDASMKIINHGPGKMNRPSDSVSEYDGAIGIEIRGGYSSTFPQKPYAVETRDSLGIKLNVSLLGMPSENDWILLTNYNDKSLVRQMLSFDLFRMMGHYAPRALLCEVILNSSYQGIYVFTEKIKRDKNRVDIAELGPEENTGDALTGGYIIKVDYHNDSDSWVSDYPPINYPRRRVYYVYSYPKPDEITPAQMTYIQNFIRATEGAVYGKRFDDPLSGYRKYLDVPSFIDYFILGEVSRNVDAYKKSRFFFKDKDSKGGLLHAGPVWDFDWAWKNINECIYSATDGSGWSYKTNDCNPDNNAPDWYIRLLQDADFTNQLIDRYSDLRSGFLDLSKINYYIDSLRTSVSEAQKRYFALYPIDKNYMAPEVDKPSKSYDEEIAKLKEWIRRRINWLDANVPELRQNIINETSVSTQKTNMQPRYQIFPNPATNHLFFEFEVPVKRITIYNMLGQKVYDAAFNNTRAETIHIFDLPTGLFFIRWTLSDGRSIVQKQTIFNDRLK
jgi:hypothetical protein